jgi:hypothetical protein
MCVLLNHGHAQLADILSETTSATVRMTLWTLQPAGVADPDGPQPTTFEASDASPSLAWRRLTLEDLTHRTTRCRRHRYSSYFVSRVDRPLVERADLPVHLSPAEPTEPPPDHLAHGIGLDVTPVLSSRPQWIASG